MIIFATYDSWITRIIFSRTASLTARRKRPATGSKFPDQEQRRRRLRASHALSVFCGCLTLPAANTSIQFRGGDSPPGSLLGEEKKLFVEPSHLASMRLAVRFSPRYLECKGRENEGKRVTREEAG